MIQVAPQKDLPIIRQLADHTDSSTNYVQAKVYKASDNSLLATVNLTDNGSQYFYGTWQTIVDVSGEGTWVIIITTVYTDSGYTTKNPNYALETRDYLIKADNSAYFGGGGGADIDYGKIRKMIDEALGTLPKPEKYEATEIDYDRINESIKMLETTVRDDLRQLVKAITAIPEPPKLDLSQVLASIEAIKQQIDARPVYKDPNFDRIVNKISLLGSDLKEAMLNSTKDLTKYKDVLEAIKEIGEKIGNIQILSLKDVEKKQKPETKSELSLFDNL